MMPAGRISGFQTSAKRLILAPQIENCRLDKAFSILQKAFQQPARCYPAVFQDQMNQRR
jgi:hypothetical protein